MKYFEHVLMFFFAQH